MWPLVKIASLIVLALIVNGLTASWTWAFFACIFVTGSYQRVVAMIVPDTIVMPVMD